MSKTTVATLTVLLLLIALAPGQPATATGCGAWVGQTGVNVANPATGWNTLHAVSAVSPTDVWAAGSYNAGTLDANLVEHWNGANWSTSPIPNPDSGDNNAYDVEAIGANDVWVVGDAHFLTSYTAEAQHYDGTWTDTFPVNPSPTANSLSGISASGPTDVWAAGFKEVKGTDRLLVEHWAGTSWHLVKTPQPGVFDQASSIEAVSAKNVWLTGTYQPKGRPTQPLVLHYLRGKWTQVPVATAKKGTTQLWGIVAMGSRFAMISGDHEDASFNASFVVEKWSKARGEFQKMKLPATTGTDNVIWDLAAASPSDVWAVGKQGSGTVQTWAMHWDGSTWTHLVTYSPSAYYQSLLGVAELPDGETWAVGSQATSAGETGGVLAEYYCP